jgi:DNA-binding ferritin-like protein
LGGTSEREFSESIARVKGKSNKTASKVKSDFVKMQKLKAESLKKVEEMMRSAEKDLERLEQRITKSQDVVYESKGRLNAEIMATRSQIKQKYTELKSSIAASIVPE